MKKNSISLDKKLSPDISYMSDRNPYLVDFSKSIQNNGKEIIEVISKDPRFRRASQNDSIALNSVDISQTLDSVPRSLKKDRSAVSLDLQKCHEIINLSSKNSPNITLERSLPGIKIPSSIKNPVKVELAHTKKLPNLFPMISKGDNYLRNPDLVENSRYRTKKIKDLIKDIDKKYFTPGSVVAKPKKIKMKKDVGSKLMLQQSTEDSVKADSQFEIAKKFNINSLYQGVDRFLRMKRKGKIIVIKHS